MHRLGSRAGRRWIDRLEVRVTAQHGRGTSEQQWYETKNKTHDLDLPWCCNLAANIPPTSAQSLDTGAGRAIDIAHCPSRAANGATHMARHIRRDGS